jgi:hypothetical protein
MLFPGYPVMLAQYQGYFEKPLEKVFHIFQAILTEDDFTHWIR